ncbi:MAG: tetratricopeptide repeat protein [Bacteroidota bacterium]|nr:tetratricopeptide repeat protein [Bacteroidota bacterium]
MKALVNISLVFCLLLISDSLRAQTIRSLVSNGNHLYEKNQYSDAEAEYRKSLEKDKDLMEGSYNLGNAVYKQHRFDEAVQNYNQALSKTNDKTTQSQLYYNMGNSYLDAKQYQESINAYKNSLKLNPQDDDAKYNLSYAYKMLNQQQQQKKQQQKQNKDKKQDEKQQKQDQQQQKQQQQKQQQQQDLAQQQKKMSQEDAKRILEALKNDEKKTQKKIRQRTPVRVNVEKDW